MSKAQGRFATVWLDGCSGCHMSFSIWTSACWIAGAGRSGLQPAGGRQGVSRGRGRHAGRRRGFSSEEDLHKIKLVRERTKILVSLGDCAVTGNVPAMRNPFRRQGGAATAPIARTSRSIPAVPTPGRARAAAERRARCTKLCTVDVFVPGCPPSADIIYLRAERTAGRAHAGCEFETATEHA